MIQFNQKKQLFEVVDETGKPVASDVPKQKLVQAGSIDQGQCFRKKNGTFVYLRISESSVSFAGLDSAYVWGVCYNGNLCHVKPDTLVHLERLESMMANQGDEDRWNETFSNFYDHVSEESK